MKIRKRLTLFNVLLFLSCFCLNYLILSYCFTDYYEVSELEATKLTELYDSLKMNSLLVKKVSDIDVSYILCQYDIARMRIRYGFNYDTAKILYQYHQYHNIRIGSTNILIEYADLFTEIESNKKYNKFPKEWSDLSIDQQQKARLGLIIFCGYWFVILLGSCIISNYKK